MSWQALFIGLSYNARFSSRDGNGKDIIWISLNHKIEKIYEKVALRKDGHINLSLIT